MDRRDIRLGAVGPWGRDEADEAIRSMQQGESQQEGSYLTGHIIAGQFWSELPRNPPLSRWSLAPSPWVIGGASSSASVAKEADDGPSREIWRLHRRSREGSDSHSQFSTPVRHSSPPSLPSSTLHPLPPMPPSLPKSSTSELTRTPATPPRKSTVMTTPDSASSNRSKWKPQPLQGEDLEADLIDLSARMMKGFVSKVSRFPLLLSFKLWAAEARESRPLRIKAESMRSVKILLYSIISLQENAVKRQRSRKLKSKADEFFRSMLNARMHQVIHSWYAITLKSFAIERKAESRHYRRLMASCLTHWRSWADRKAYYRCLAEELEGEYSARLLVNCLRHWHHRTQEASQRTRTTLSSYLKASDLKRMDKIVLSWRERSKESIIAAEAASIDMSQSKAIRVLRAWKKQVDTGISLLEAERWIRRRSADIRTEHYLILWRTALIDRQRVMLARGMKMRRCLRRWLVLARDRSLHLSVLSSELKVRLKTLLCLLCLRCWKFYASDSLRRRSRMEQWPLLCRCFHSWRSIAIARNASYPSLMSSQPLVSSPDPPKSESSGIRSYFSKMDTGPEDPFAQLSTVLRKGHARHVARAKSRG